jgi:hypothetical protein
MSPILNGLLLNNPMENGLSKLILEDICQDATDVHDQVYPTLLSYMKPIQQVLILNLSLHEIDLEQHNHKSILIFE